MAKDSLTLEISGQLLDALNIPSDKGGDVDYFMLLGVKPGADKSKIEAAVLHRTKSLKKWQASPQYGKEVVELLGVLHRAARILKDPNRGSAYAEELDRARRGVTVDARTEFEMLVRAAIADNSLTDEARNQLAEFAQRNGLEKQESAEIVQKVREDMDKARHTEAPPEPVGDPEDTDFRIKADGVDGFVLNLTALESSGQLNPKSVDDMLKQCERFKISPQQAQRAIKSYMKDAFRRMLRRVAGNRAINEMQAKLVMPKAMMYGLSQEEAYKIISDYTLTARSAEDLFGISLTETFDDTEIKSILEDRTDVLNKPTLRSMLMANLGRTSGIAAAIVLAIVGLVFLSTYLMDNLFKEDLSDRIVAGPDATPTPTPAPTLPPLVRLPDPANGMLRLEPETPGDPPVFEMKITEVSNEEYRGFIRATLGAAPTHWENGNYPPGRDQYPATRMEYADAEKFLRWKERELKLQVGELLLPSQAEYQRAIRGRTLRGNPMTADYFQQARLGGKIGTSAVTSTQWDRIHIEGVGQIYDLVGNAAEWMRGGTSYRRQIWGGDFMIDDPEFNYLHPRSVDGSTAHPNVGFRYIRRVR